MKSITRWSHVQSPSFVENQLRSRTTFSCESCCIIDSSRFWYRSSSATRLIAHGSPDSRSTARHTVPNAPFPTASETM